MRIRGYAAVEPGHPLRPFEYEVGELGANEVEIDVKHCGICYSDLSMWKNDWGMTQFPFVPGHEVVGTIGAVGSSVKHLKPGQSVGLGWFSRSCMECRQCMQGDHNLCAGAEGTIVGRFGGFAEKVRADKNWVIPLPDSANISTAGPLMCGGATVFTPIVESGIQAGDRAGVIGVGGLGHMALRFLRAWGCEVYAFSTSPEKEDDSLHLGAHRFVNTKQQGAIESLAGSFDLILVTVNADLPWDAYIAALKPRGTLHVVGALGSITASVFPLIVGQKSISASPVASPAVTAQMLEFAALHQIGPIVERFSLSDANDAFTHLEAGDARYRIILDNDIP